jgi:hypothetical protein
MPIEPTAHQSPLAEKEGSGHEPDQKQPDPDTTDLNHEATQTVYRKEYLEQQRRQNCPGCGDDGSHF